MFARIIALVSNVEEGAPPVQMLAGSVAAWLIPVVFGY